MINRPARRPTPKMRAQDYKTYSLQTPTATHTRVGTCAEMDCPAWRNGWSLRIEHMDAQMRHVAMHSGRHYQEVSIVEGETYMVFAPGQMCFEVHRVPLQREPFYFVGRGDHRMFDVRRARQHANGDDFVDDFASHQDALATELERG